MFDRRPVSFVKWFMVITANLSLDSDKSATCGLEQCSIACRLENEHPKSKIFEIQK